MRTSGSSVLRRTRRGALAIALAATGVATAGLPAHAAPSAAATHGSTSTTEKVIVVLRDQLATTPADATHVARRGSAARAAQRAVLARLAGPAPAHLKQFTVGNAFAATVTQAQAAALAADPAVASVILDRDVSIAPTTAAAVESATGATPDAAQAPAATGSPAPVSSAACSSDKRNPQLEPEALQTIHARSSDPTAKTAASLGIDGSGVKVAFIADGIDPKAPGFLRTNGKSAIVDYKDFYGDGPDAPTGGEEAFGDASAIAAQGNVTYDVAKFANPSVVSYPSGHCYIKIVGVAPGASIVALKAGSELLPDSSILQAIDYAVSVDHVDVLSESFGSNVYPDSGTRNTIELFDNEAVKAGTTVTVSTGDAGTSGTIGSPASDDPSLISAGASTDSRIYEQIGYALATQFGNGKWVDDEISSLSSAGITQQGRTIDVSAPGEADWALCEASPRFDECASYQGTRSNIVPFGGTSQAAPMTAGVAALVIQAYRKGHGGTSPAPAVVKQIITSTADDLGFDGIDQGAGRIDARSAVEAALTWPGATKAAPAGTGQNIAVSTDQLALQGAPGSTVTGSVKVTNVGTATQTVVPSTRQYAAFDAERQTTVMRPTTSGHTTPYPTSGAPWAYKKLSFTVPAGADVLDSSIRWASGTAPGGTGPVVRLSLFAPDGTYVANTRPQGGPAPANYGDTLVRQPAAGTWTAVLYTPVSGGFTGSVTLATVPERAEPVGTVSGPFTLAPGASRRVAVSVPLTATGGDSSYTLSLGSSGGHRVAVPIVARAVVPTGNGVGHFAGTISGGNARAYAPAQTFGYSFDVPAGHHDLDVGFTLARAGDQVYGVLTDPNGETPSIENNVRPAAPSKSGTSVENVVADPTPGRWTYTVVVSNPVVGTTFARDFTGTVAFDRFRASISGLPSTIKAGKATTATVRVTNPGPAPIAVQADPRTTSLGRLQLVPQFAGSTFSLPLTVDNLAAVPAYSVPPDTRSIGLSAASTVPAQVELQSPGYGIDEFGDLAQAQGGDTVSTASVREASPAFVGQGLWGTYVQEIGPFGDGGAPSGSTTLTMDAVTAGFDRATVASTGDPWLPTVDPTAGAGRAVVIPPGESATFTVTVTPTAAAGSTVDGILNIVSAPGSLSGSAVAAGSPNVTGEVFAAVPYSYKVS